MNHYVRRLALLLMAGFCWTSVHAQDIKIGFVSTDRVIREAAQAKAATAKLEQEFSKREKDLADMAASVKAAAAKFERDAPTLPEAQRLAQQKQLIAQDRDFQREQREFREDLNSRKNDELQQVIERANRVIKEIAAAEKYDIIFQDVVYINPKHDMTDKVIKALNVPAAK